MLPNITATSSKVSVQIKKTYNNELLKQIPPPPQKTTNICPWIPGGIQKTAAEIDILIDHNYSRGAQA